MDGTDDRYIGLPGIVRLHGSGMGRGSGAGSIGGGNPFMGCADFENAITESRGRYGGSIW